MKMAKECFTCANKISRELSKEERREYNRLYKERTGKICWSTPEMEFTCKVSGLKINQTDPACEHYEGDEVMEGLRSDLAQWAKKEREKLRKNS